MPDLGTLTYQGRKASLSKSEDRRRAILEASLKIILEHGVRGLRHRAIAKEANVPLAATTYYFKDIHELISDTFTLYTEKALLIVEQFTQQIHTPLSEMLDIFRKDPNSDKAELIEPIVELVMKYHTEQTGEYRNMLIIEQAFRYEAIRHENLKALAHLHQETLKQKLSDVLSELNAPKPIMAAEILLSLLHSFEYQALLAQADSNRTRTSIRSTLHYAVTKLLDAQ